MQSQSITICSGTMKNTNLVQAYMYVTMFMKYIITGFIRANPQNGYQYWLGLVDGYLRQPHLQSHHDFDDADWMHWKWARIFQWVYILFF